MENTQPMASAAGKKRKRKVSAAAPLLKDLVIPSHIYDVLFVEKIEKRREIRRQETRRDELKGELEGYNRMWAASELEKDELKGSIRRVKELIRQNKKKESEEEVDKEVLKQEKEELREEKKELKKEMYVVKMAREPFPGVEKSIRDDMVSNKAVLENLQQELEKHEQKLLKAKQDVMCLLNKYAEAHKYNKTHITIRNVGQLMCLKKLSEWCDFVHSWSIEDEKNLPLVFSQQIFSVPGSASQWFNKCTPEQVTHSPQPQPQWLAQLTSSPNLSPGMLINFFSFDLEL